MVVWSDVVDDITASVLDTEARLLKLVWMQRPGAASPGPASGFGSQSRTSLTNKKVGDIELLEKGSTGGIGVPSPDTLSVTKEKELEEGLKVTPRPIRILAPVYIGLATALSTCELSFTTSSQPLY